MKRANMLPWVGGVVLCLATGCTTSLNRIESPSASKLNSPETRSDELYFTYSISDSLNVKVTFENYKAYDAVQVGLYLLQETKGEVEKKVPTIEEDSFFPEYFVMVNVDISDGLLFISENEATGFACAMYLEYQKKVVPSEYLGKKHKRRLMEDFSGPKTDEKGTLSSLPGDKKG